MPIRFVVDHAAQRVAVTADGELRLEDMVAVLNELASQRCFAYPRCFDVRSAVTLLTAEDVRRLVALTSRLRADHGEAKTAFIAESDVSFGMARMYATLAAETDSGFMVYRTLPEGEAWLGWDHAPPGQSAR